MMRYQTKTGEIVHALCKLLMALAGFVVVVFTSWLMWDNIGLESRLRKVESQTTAHETKIKDLLGWAYEMTPIFEDLNPDKSTSEWE